jgi:hypothetical protein
MFTEEDLQEFSQMKRKRTMSFLQIGEQLNSFVEEHPVNEGEYLLRVTSAEIPEGRNYLLVRFEVTEDPYAREITKFFNLPGAGRNEKEENRNRGMLLRFFSAFDIDPAGNYNVSEQAPGGFLGREGYAMVSAPTDDGKGYGPQNRISRFNPRQ